MESSTAHYTTSKVNKVRWIVMEEWLTNQEATPTRKKEQLQRKLSNNIIKIAKHASWIEWKKKYILLCWMLPQNNINHSNCFLSMLWFLTFQSKCDCTHRNFCCERQPNFVRLCIVRSSDPFPVTSRWTVITRAAICRSPESTKMKLT